MKELATLKFVYPKGSMQDQIWKLLSMMEVFIEGYTSDGPICLTDLDLKTAAITEIDSFRSQDIPVLGQLGIFELIVCGEDWIRERKADVEIVTMFALSRSTFNPIKLILAVPQKSGFNSLTDLSQGAVVATEYPVTAREHFDCNGRSDLEIQLSYGDTERKVVIGAADAIVDVMETGKSLRQNGLLVIDQIAESRMTVSANKTAYADPKKGPAIRLFAEMIQDCYRLMLLEERK